MTDDHARLVVRLCSWISLATGVAGGVLVAFPSLLPAGGPWVQLGLGVVTLVLSFRARSVGMKHVEGFDGRMSLGAAILGFIVVFFAGQVAFGILAAAS
ncbi:hypothetical protein [Microbacterium sp. YY-01]|uniref:hypothetical protein n=1 Tax=Microbacterium sp. YY-01 TaxID=3421634 RepID=UPI003D178EA5